MNVDWISITPQSGKAGTALPISFQLIAENDSFEDKTIKVRAVCGNKSAIKTITLKGKSYPVGTVFNFNYTGNVQEVTLPPGKYKLQCWGAQGGNSSSYSGVGSKGGYSEGMLTLTEATKLYIFVGGKGASSGNGGWNCGGGSTGSSSYNSGNTYGRSYPACGGGGTDIATVTSSMAYSSKRNNRSAASLLSRCIVAGGGAGASARYTEVTTTSESHVTKINKTFYDENAWENPTTGNISYYLYYYTNISQYRGKKARITLSGTGTARYLQYIITGENGEIARDNIESASSVFNLSIPNEAINIEFQVFGVANSGVYPTSATVVLEILETTTSTDTSSSKSNSSQQGGGTSGRGTSPGTQTSGGGDFGSGKNQGITNYRYASGAGGGGWYGGGSSYSDSSTSQINSSGGGSGFVNTAANASSRPSGYTGLQLDSGSTKDGATSFPSPSGGNETGHSGNGYARITVADENGNVPDTPVTSSYNWAVQSGTWNESSNSDAVDGIMVTCQSPGDNGSTVIRCTFRGLSSITFRCRYQGESSYDYLTVGNIDSSCTRSSYKTSLKGSSGTWKDLTYSVSDKGEHYVEFCYSKDGSVDTSPDNADVLIYNVTE